MFYKNEGILGLYIGREIKNAKMFELGLSYPFSIFTLEGGFFYIQYKMNADTREIYNLYSRIRTNFGWEWREYKRK